MTAQLLTLPTADDRAERKKLPIATRQVAGPDGSVRIEPAYANPPPRKQPAVPMHVWLARQQEPRPGLLDRLLGRKAQT